MHFNKLIVKSDNKVKTVWKIVKKRKLVNNLHTLKSHQ
jgi:hypothetical protein